MACASATGPDTGAWLTRSRGDFTLYYQSADADRSANLLDQAVAGGARIATELTPISAPVSIRVYPDRTLLDPAWRQMMGAPNFQFECWMIAGASASTVLMLSPRAYTCNPTDAGYVAKVVVHELVHVVHRRANTDPSCARMGPATWFVEGLATYLSGQHDEGARRAAEDALRNTANLRLATLWSGSAGYPLSAALVAYLDATRGPRVPRRADARIDAGRDPCPHRSQRR